MPPTNIRHEEIVEYWSARETECGLGVDWAEAHERCWRCGYKSGLERCHIIPESLGGRNEPSNLVLLCGRCHREAPNVRDARFMWIWLRASCAPFYDTYWATRGVQEFERIFGREPFAGPEFNNIETEQARQALREEMRKTTLHLGEGRLNPATIAFLFALIEERFIGKPISFVSPSAQGLAPLHTSHSALSGNGAAPKPAEVERQGASTAGGCEMSEGSDANRKRESRPRAILATGIPLEMAVYDFLAQGLGADWIEPEYEFTALNEDGREVQRSVDFVASVPTSPEPLDERSVQLYILTECKYCSPKEFIWLFMPDASPKTVYPFDDWRPALWQAKTPVPSIQTREVTRCVRGAILGISGQDTEDGKRTKDQRRMPMLATAQHQLRDCLHHVATERFRMFTQKWDQPRALVFVPILVTNVEMRILKPGVHRQLLSARGDSQLSLEEVTTLAGRLLVRCPGSLEQVNRKWQQFQEAHGKYDLRRVEEGLPFYKRERTIEFHIRNFFESTPAYILVANLGELTQLLGEIVSWAKGLRFGQE